MRFVVFTHAEHFKEGGSFYSYSPYVREMNIWFDLVDEVQIVAPLKRCKSRIDISYNRKNLSFKILKSIELTSFRKIISSLIRIPGILYRIFSTMSHADHIHIRCPGNIGMLASIVQILFPGKIKTIKYAGNWDPKSIQPWTYRLQKWILNNECLTRNAKVLVYGEWPNQGKNIMPFFTSSYSNTVKNNYKKVFFTPFRFVFVGSLTEGKRPLLALKIVNNLIRNGCEVSLDFYGSGTMAGVLNEYAEKNELGKAVTLHGNQDPEIILEAYRNSHFSILPSKSEGWPKAIAEAMFVGCIPITTSVSCTPWMLGSGKRGILIEPNTKIATKKLINVISDKQKLQKLSLEAQKWSQLYTLEKFKIEIRKLL